MSCASVLADTALAASAAVAVAAAVVAVTAAGVYHQQPHYCRSSTWAWLHQRYSP